MASLVRPRKSAAESKQHPVVVLLFEDAAAAAAGRSSLSSSRKKRRINDRDRVDVLDEDAADAERGISAAYAGTSVRVRDRLDPEVAAVDAEAEGGEEEQGVGAELGVRRRSRGPATTASLTMTNHIRVAEHVLKITKVSSRFLIGFFCEDDEGGGGGGDDVAVEVVSGDDAEVAARWSVDEVAV